MPRCYEFSLPWLVGTMEVLGVIRLTALRCFFPGLMRLVLNQRLRGRGVSSLCRNPGHSLRSPLLSHTMSLTCSCQALLNLDLCLPIGGKNSHAVCVPASVLWSGNSPPGSELEGSYSSCPCFSFLSSQSCVAHCLVSGNSC